MDVEAMEFTLKAYLFGDRSACRPVRLLSVAEGDAKRLSRKRTQLKKERTRHVNRIRALLVLHGIRSVLVFGEDAGGRQFRISGPEYDL